MLCKPPPLVPEHFHNDVILEEKNESQVDRTLALVGHLTGRSFIQGGGRTLGCLPRGTPPPPGHGSGWDDFLDCMSPSSVCSLPPIPPLELPRRSLLPPWQLLTFPSRVAALTGWLPLPFLPELQFITSRWKGPSKPQIFSWTWNHKFRRKGFYSTGRRQ